MGTSVSRPLPLTKGILLGIGQLKIERALLINAFRKIRILNQSILRSLDLVMNTKERMKSSVLPFVEYGFIFLLVK